MNQTPKSNEPSNDGLRERNAIACNAIGTRGALDLSYRAPQTFPHRIFHEYRENGPSSFSPGRVTRKSPAGVHNIDTMNCLQIKSEGTSETTSLRLDVDATTAIEIEGKPVFLRKNDPEEKAPSNNITKKHRHLSLDAPQPPELTLPKPPPSSSPFSQSPAWLPKAPSASARLRKMAPVSRLSSRPNLLRNNSFRSATSSKFSSKDDDSSSYATGDEMISMTDFSESYLDDDYTEFSSVCTEEPDGGIIAIGIPTPPKPAPPTPKTKEEEHKEFLNEVVAKDIAEQEHNLKMKRRASSEGGGVLERRLSAPCLPNSMVEAKRKGRVSLTSHVQPRKSFLASLRDSPTVSLEEPTPYAAVRTASLDSAQFDARDVPKAPPMAVTPRLRARKSGGLASMVSPADRREKVRTAMGAMGPARAMPPPPTSHLRRTSTLDRPSRKSPPGLKSTCETDESESDDEDQFSARDRKPPSLRSDASVASGIDLDDKTRNTIIARSSHVQRMRKLTSRVDEKAMERVSVRSAQSMASTASSARSGQSSEAFALDHEETSSSAAVACAPLARRTSSCRPSDEKRASRISLPSRTDPTRAQQARPSDEKVNYRHDLSASRPGAHAVAHAPRAEREREKSGGGLLQLAAGDSRDHVEQAELPFGPVTSSDVGLSDDDEDHELEAQAGVPIVLPGAFAITSRDQMGQPSSGYDSGFEENSVGSAECRQAVVEAEDPEEPAEGALRPEVPDNPVEAELYEELHADAQVLKDGEGEKYNKRQVRIIQAFSTILIIIVVVGIALGVVFSGNGSGSSSEEPEVPVVEGWSQVGGVLTGPTDRDNIRFGFSISMSEDGTRLAIGLPGLDGDDDDDSRRRLGSVFIMDFNGTDWLKVHQIEGPGMNAEAGKTLSLSQDGKRVAVGAPSWENSGYVAVYEELEWGNWTLVGKVLAGGDYAGESFGGSLGLSADGKILAVGDKLADGDDGVADVGKVRVFHELNNTWTKMGTDIMGETEGDLFGWSLSVSGDGTRFAASALGVDGFAGNLRAFDFDGASWVQIGQSLTGETERENFGTSVALSSDATTLAVGATGYSRQGMDVGVGRVRTFRLDKSEGENWWIPLGEPIEGTNKFDAFGTSVALSSDGNVLAGGGPENDAFGENCGHVQVAKFNGDSWEPIGSALGSAETAGGQMGFAVALSADASRLASAAPFSNFDGFISDVGQVWVYEAIDAD